MEIDPLSYSGYGVYPTKPDNADDVAPWSAHTVRFRESTIATAPDRWVAWRLAYRHYEAWAHPHIAQACDIDGMPLAWSFHFDHLAAGITGDDHL